MAGPYSGGRPPREVPPAFRGRQQAAPGFAGMDDDEVLRVAASALRMVTALPLGSEARAAQWKSFEAAMAELGSRAVTQTLAKIYEIDVREQRGPEPLG